MMAKKPPPPSGNLFHISHNDEIWYRFTLLKEDPKTYKSRDMPRDTCSHQHFFTILEIQINYILIHFFLILVEFLKAESFNDAGRILQAFLK